MHQLIETRRSSDNRKIYYCTCCKQAWTYEPTSRIACPGVPVVSWNSNQPGTLRTRTQAKKEHYLLPDNAKRVAVLRLNSDPWYISLYDVSECEQRLPTEKQRQSAAQREQAIRERYGCRLCSKRYLKREARSHQNGVCFNCRGRATGWNQALQWARDLLIDPPSLLIFTTDPAGRSMRDGLYSPSYRAVGYQSIDLRTGEVIAEKPLAQPEDYATLYGLLHMTALAGGETKPIFFLPSSGDQSLFWRSLRENSPLVDWGWQKLVTIFPEYLPVPLPDRHWRSAPPLALSQERYYYEICRTLGIPVELDASVESMLPLVIRHLADREMLAL